MLNAGRQGGMSLIELMIGLALAALLLTLAAPSLTTAMHNRQIRTAAEAIQNGLTLARTEALRRNRTVVFELRSAGGWRIGCDPADATVVNGEVVCPATVQTREGQAGSANASTAPVQLTGGVPAASPVFTGNLRFTSLGRVATDTLPAGSVAAFQVTNPTGGTCSADGGEMRCLSVRVTAAGQVRMCDPAVTSPDPRAC